MSSADESKRSEGQSKAFTASEETLSAAYLSGQKQSVIDALSDKNYDLAAMLIPELVKEIKDRRKERVGISIHGLWELICKNHDEPKLARAMLDAGCSLNPCELGYDKELPPRLAALNGKLQLVIFFCEQILQDPELAKVRRIDFFTVRRHSEIWFLSDGYARFREEIKVHPGMAEYLESVAVIDEKFQAVKNNDPERLKQLIDLHRRYMSPSDWNDLLHSVLLSLHVRSVGCSGQGNL